VPNRGTVSLREKLATLGYDPMNELISISRDRETPLQVRVQIHLGICPYLYPKCKPVDVSIEEPMVTNVITDLEGDQCSS